jgi:hypothetical protein
MPGRQIRSRSKKIGPAINRGRGGKHEEISRAESGRRCGGYLRFTPQLKPTPQSLSKSGSSGR